MRNILSTKKFPTGISGFASSRQPGVDLGSKRGQNGLTFNCRTMKQGRSLPFNPSQSPARRARRVAGYFIAMAWFLLVLVVAESVARLLEHTADTRAESYGPPIVNAHWAEDDARAAQLAGEAGKPSDLQLYATLPKRSTDERLAFAQTREEIYFLCDASGYVIEKQSPATPEYLARAAAEVGVGQAPCQALLRGDAAADCAAALTDPASASLQGPRFYPSQIDGPLVDNTEWLIQPTDNGSFIIIRPSLWKVPFESLRPGAERREGTRMRGNNAGFRGEDVPDSKLPGELRVVCIGGSTTMEGKADALTYPERMQELLRDATGNRGIEVINAGIDVMDAQRIANSFDRYLALQPDIIVHYNFVNDLPALMPLWSGVEEGGLRAWLRHSTLLYRYANRWLLPSESRIRADLSRVTFAQYQTMLDRAKAAGVSMVFATFAYPDARRISKQDAEFLNYKLNNQGWGWNRVVDLDTYGYLVRLHNDMLAEFCAARNVPCIVLPDELNSGLDVFYDICHMFQSGIDRKAQGIAEGLLPVVKQPLEVQGQAGVEVPGNAGNTGGR